MRLLCSSQHDPPGHFHVCTCTRIMMMCPCQESKWRSKNMQRSQAARQQTKSPAVQEAIARRSALQRSGASGKKGSGNGRNGSGKR